MDRKGTGIALSTNRSALAGRRGQTNWTEGSDKKLMRRVRDCVKIGRASATGPPLPVNTGRTSEKRETQKLGVPS
jgi:hypothetical protein